MRLARRGNQERVVKIVEDPAGRGETNGRNGTGGALAGAELTKAIGSRAVKTTIAQIQAREDLKIHCLQGASMREMSEQRALQIQP